MLLDLVERVTHALARWVDRVVYDGRRGADTGGKIDLDDLTIDGRNVARGVGYVPTPTRALRKLFQSLQVPVDEGFVDIGCGKGRVLMLAAEYGFTWVTGVEFSPQLCEVAQANLRLTNKRLGGALRVDIVNIDAADYEIDDRQSVFFVYNPFDDYVFRQVLENMEVSVRRRPRKLLLIYHNPVCGAVVKQSALFTSLRTHYFGGCEFLVCEREMTMV